jgi:hypothetical protein
MTMQITVTTDDLTTLRGMGSSVLTVTGTDKNGDRVTFAGDHRPMATMLDALIDGEDTEVTAEVEPWQQTGRVPLRKATVARNSIGGPTGEVVANYLPSNYKVTEVTETEVFIEGHDNAGWTLDDYVIPRLASGMIWAKEVASDASV